MTRTFISFFLLFLLMVALQVVIFNRIWLFNVALPLVFIYFFITLPTDLNPKWVLTLSFLIGFIVDIFSDTLGVNTLSCTLTAGARPFILKLYIPHDEDKAMTIPSPRSIGRFTYMKYLITMTTLYCLVFFIVLSFEFFSLGRLVARVCASSALTFLLLLAFSNFLVPAPTKN